MTNISTPTSVSHCVSERSSHIISSLRFPLTILVLFSHCVLVREFRPVPFSLDGDTLFLAIDSLTRSIGAVVVAWFSLISGFFFFKTRNFEFSTYTRALTSRIHSLLIPYLLWNIVCFAVLWLKINIATHIGFTPGYPPIEVLMLQNLSLSDIFIGPLNGPLWYIRELIYLTLISPLVFVLVRYLRIFAVLLFTLAHLSLLPVEITKLYPFSIDITFYFVLGSYLSLSKIDPITLSRKLRWVGMVGTMVYPILLLGYCNAPYFDWTFSLAKACLVITIFNIAGILYDKRSPIIDHCIHLSRTAFFVYAIHSIAIINLVRGLLYMTPLGDYGYGHILILFITGISVSLLSVTAYHLAVRLMPRLTAILCGGRI